MDITLTHTDKHTHTVTYSTHLTVQMVLDGKMPLIAAPFTCTLPIFLSPSLITLLPIFLFQ